jgi:hypothetical protein
VGTLCTETKVNSAQEQLLPLVSYRLAQHGGPVGKPEEEEFTVFMEVAMIHIK